MSMTPQRLTDSVGGRSEAPGPLGVAAMGLVWGGLLGLSLSAERLPCAAVAGALAVLAGLVALSGTEAALARRRAFVGQWLVPGGRLHRLLGGGALILARHVLGGLFLGLALLVAALALEPPQWALLLADVALLALLVAGLSRFLAGEVRAHYRGPLARSWAVRTNAVLLWAAWLALAVQSPTANYTGMRWEEVVALSAAQPRAACEALAVPARLASVTTALGLWSAQHTLGGLREPAQQLAAWAGFLAAFGVSFVVAWAYSRALAGVLARPWAVSEEPPP